MHYVGHYTIGLRKITEFLGREKGVVLDVRNRQLQNSVVGNSRTDLT
jgi:hypothetical protein